MTPSLQLDPMSSDDIAEAAELVARAMNTSEGAWAQQTMSIHFASVRKGLRDGRTYFVWRSGGALCGLVGLHHYHWGPPRNVWLSWFAVEPGLQGRGYGRALLRACEHIAREHGYRKIFVETYDQPEFNRARSFYRRQGLQEAGRIENYLEDGAAMVVFQKDL